MGDPASIERRLSVTNMTWRPASSAVMSGWCSRPTKCRCGAPGPGSISMYEPDSRVPRPRAPRRLSCGRTTQKRVFRRRKWSVPWLKRMVSTTFAKSSLNWMPSTMPMSTSLYLTMVLPASMPSAVRNAMVTSGPRSEMVLTISQPPTINVTSGMSHTMEGPERLRTFGLSIVRGPLIPHPLQGCPKSTWDRSCAQRTW